MNIIFQSAPEILLEVSLRKYFRNRLLDFIRINVSRNTGSQHHLNLIMWSEMEKRGFFCVWDIKRKGKEV